MKPTYSYTIHKDVRLVVENFSGSINAEFIKNCQLQLRSDPNFDDSFNILVDFRGASMAIMVGETDTLASVHDSCFKSSSAKTAILVANPRETAISMVVASRIKSRIIQHFFTSEAAYDWLGMDEKGEN